MALMGVVNLIIPKKASDMADGVASGLVLLQVSTRTTEQPKPSSLLRGRVNIQLPRKK